MKDYSFVPIPIITIYFRHDFINGGHKWPICGTTETVILSTRGTQSLEPGYVWAPYIPMNLETEFQPIQGVASRYATKLVDEGFYGRITMNEVYNGVQLPRVKRRFV